MPMLLPLPEPPEMVLPSNVYVADVGPVMFLMPKDSFPLPPLRTLFLIENAALWSEMAAEKLPPPPVMVNPSITKSGNTPTLTA